MSGYPSVGLQRFLVSTGDALRRGDVAMAMNYADQAVTLGFEDVNLLTLAGQLRMRSGNLDGAYKVLTRAKEVGPQSVEALNALAVCLGLMGRPRDAIAQFDEALAVAPGTPYLELHRSQPLEDVGRLREAQKALEIVLAAEPQNVNALGRIANLCARRGDMAAAREYGTRLLALGPYPSAIIALTMVDLSDGAFEKARARIAPLTADVNAGSVNQTIALGLLGDALDGLDKPAEAFAAYAKSRELIRATFANLFVDKESAVDRVRRLARYFGETDIAPWVARPAMSGASPVETHVFLVGFPRSGTTLLEQALASHGEVRTMEEIDCLGDTVGEYFYAADGQERFAALSDDALAALRTQYWQRVAAAGIATDRKVFVDKMPLNSVHQGMIGRLFPGAKILFAIRDPRDVILSCFRRRLVMSAHMYELSKLDGAARFYDAVMTLSQVYRARLEMPTLDLRHEDMLADFDGEMRRVCDFLAVGWDDGVRDFAAHARDRDIKTPSASQVIRGLNKDGAGQWRRFAAQMTPALAVLAPWVARFGYEA